MTSERPPKIELDRLSKSFGGRVVLADISLAVAPGQSLVIIGGSGQGKSVTIKCALGLIAPDQGRVLIDGVDVTHAKGAQRDAMMRRCGLLFQGGALFDSLTVWENVAFRLIYRDRVRRSDARARAIEAMARVRLRPEAAELRPAELSGGMQKRVGLARAIMGGPEVLFFDEPTTGLDPITADAINELIVEQTKALGAAAVSITHDLVSARRIADEIAMLHEGRIIWRGPASAMYESGDPRVDQFVHGRATGPIAAAI